MTDLNSWTISGHGLTATFTNWGASLVDLRLDGHAPPLVLGLQNLDDYVAGHSQYMGATAGRVANRIGQARFKLDGVEYRTDPNVEGRHTLHGGSAGFGKRLWDLVEVTPNMIRFGLSAFDREMGFPGNMDVQARFVCAPDATLRVDYRATTDAPTVCNLAHHSYWCLDDTGDISQHELAVNADRYSLIDADLIPTGTAPVDGTPFDFRKGRTLPGDGLLDHNLCLSAPPGKETSKGRSEPRLVALLSSKASGLKMYVNTTEPGLQVYDGAKLNTPVPGLDGQRYGPHSGIALEPQIWPDAPNHPDFPDATLRPDETYRQTTTFNFSKD